MNISPLAVKVVSGLGVLSVAAVGGKLFLDYRSTSTQENTSAFSGWNVSVDPNTLTDQTSSKIITATIKGNHGDESWTCKIKGKISNPQTGKSIKVKEQLEEKLGIENGGSIQKNKESVFTKFFENCKKHLETNKTSTINLGEITLVGENEYRFIEETLKPLYEGTIDTKKEIIKNLGIDETTCKSESGCDLDESQLQKIKFHGKDNSNLGLKTKSNTVNLKIQDSNNANLFPFGLRFIFNANQVDNELEKTGSQTTSFIKFSRQTDLEFQVEKTESQYSLKQRWDVGKLSSKVGLTCPSNDDSTCTFGTKINVFESPNSYVIGATVSLSGKSITFEKDKANYNQGFKFKYSGEDVALSATNTNKQGTISKALKKDATYEIKLQNTTENNKAWFLSETTDKEMINKLENIPESCKYSSNNSCQLTKEEFKKLNIISSKNEKWSANLHLSGSGKLLLSWSKSSKNDPYFPLGWEFLLKSESENITVQKDQSSSADSITVDKTTGTKLFLKEDGGKYYLAQELSQEQKEKEVGISCTEPNNCCIVGSSVKGITGETNQIKISKLTEQSGEQKYQVTNNSTPQNYKIIYTGTEWQLQTTN